MLSWRPVTKPTLPLAVRWSATQNPTAVDDDRGCMRMRDSSIPDALEVCTTPTTTYVVICSNHSEAGTSMAVGVALTVGARWPWATDSLSVYYKRSQTSKDHLQAMHVHADSELFVANTLDTAMDVLFMSS